MKIYWSSLNKNEIKEEHEVISFKEVDDPILELNNIDVKAYISLGYELIHIDFKIKGKIKVKCSYTLKPLDYDLNIDDSIDFSSDEDNIDAVYIKGNEINLNPYILDLIYCSIPTRIVDKNAPTSIIGDGFSVISEKDLIKEKEENKSSPFDILKDEKF